MSEQTPVSELSFEQAMAELEGIVTALEQGDLPLEQALAQFERAVSLSRYSQQTLQKAEQKVSILMRNEQGEEQLTDFNTSDDASNHHNE